MKEPWAVHQATKRVLADLLIRTFVLGPAVPTLTWPFGAAGGMPMGLARPVRRLGNMLAFGGGERWDMGGARLSKGCATTAAASTERKKASFMLQERTKAPRGYAAELGSLFRRENSLKDAVYKGCAIQGLLILLHCSFTNLDRTEEARLH